MTRPASQLRLAGRTLLLSASVPEPGEAHDTVDNGAFLVEQAVVSLLRAVFSEGGRLAFGGHPSISSLMATVAGEYREMFEDAPPPDVSTILDPEPRVRFLYDTRDRPKVVRVRNWLQDHGLAPIMQEDDHSWLPGSTLEGQDVADVFVPFIPGTGIDGLSSMSVESFNHAADLQRQGHARVVPVRLPGAPESTDTPFGSDYQVEFSTFEDFSAYERLLDILERFRASPRVETSNAPVTIYQSSVFQGQFPADTRRLISQGLATPRLTPAVGNESFVPGKGLATSQVPNSLAAMRHEMISDSAADAMICIGGMPGIIEEFDLFQELRPGRPVFASRTAGGAAARLSGSVRFIEDMLPGGVHSDPPPYPLLMQILVDHLADPSTMGEPA